MQLILVLLCRGKYGCVVILCRAVALVDEIVAASLCFFGCVLICLEFLASGVKIGLGLFKLGALIAYRLLLLIEFALTAAYLLFKLAYLLFAGGKLRLCVIKLGFTLLKLIFCVLELLLCLCCLIELLFGGVKLLLCTVKLGFHLGKRIIGDSLTGRYTYHCKSNAVRHTLSLEIGDSLCELIVCGKAFVVLSLSLVVLSLCLVIIL